MSTSSPRVKDPDPPPTVVHHHDPPRLGTQRQPRGVDQGPPASESAVAGEGPGAVSGKARVRT
uniref:Uncharacterized protein n=1 Tax=Ursus americanus TaxID=9643 RepID=A0A452RG99_URSAM